MFSRTLTIEKSFPLSFLNSVYRVLLGFVQVQKIEMEGVQEESIVQTCGLTDLPGDLLDRCLCQLSLSNLVLCEQVRLSEGGVV